jgi:hypothetical protein
LVTDDAEARWKAARQLLEEAAPGAKNFLPDALIAHLVGEYSKPEWTVLPQLGEGADSEVWGVLRSYIPYPDSALAVLVVDQSYAPGIGPFVLSLGEIARMANAFATRYDDEIFGGDALMFMPEVGSILIVHHSGVFSLVSKD